MRKSKTRCASCVKWHPCDEWHSTHNPHFYIESEGICSGTGRKKLNVERSCPFYEEDTSRGVMFNLETD